MEKCRIAPELTENGTEDSQDKHPSGHQGRNEERRVGVMQARLPETSSYFGIKRQPTGHQDQNVEGRVEVAIVPMPAVSQMCTDMMPSSVNNVERRVEVGGEEESGKVPKLLVVVIIIIKNGSGDYKKQRDHQDAPKPSIIFTHRPATAAPQGRSRQRAKEGDECRNSNPST